jgi:hypothetical protein
MLFDVLRMICLPSAPHLAFPYHRHTLTPVHAAIYHP